MSSSDPSPDKPMILSAEFITLNPPKNIGDISPDQQVTPDNKEAIEKIREADRELAAKYSDYLDALRHDIETYTGPDRELFIVKCLTKRAFFDRCYEWASAVEQQKTSELNRQDQYPSAMSAESDNAWEGRTSIDNAYTTFTEFCYRELGGSGNAPEIWDNYDNPEIFRLKSQYGELELASFERYQGDFLANSNGVFDLEMYSMYFDKLAEYIDASLE